MVNQNENMDKKTKLTILTTFNLFNLPKQSLWTQNKKKLRKENNSLNKNLIFLSNEW